MFRRDYNLPPGWHTLRTIGELGHPGMSEIGHSQSVILAPPLPKIIFGNTHEFLKYQ